MYETWWRARWRRAGRHTHSHRRRPHLRRHGWPEAVDGCDYVLQVASPFPPDEPSDANKVIVPAGLGTLRVLRAARHAGVERVVLTSSFAAIAHGHGKVDREFTEEDSTNLDGEGVTAYVKSKVLAERAAWTSSKTKVGRPTSVSIRPPRSGPRSATTSPPR